MTDTCAAKGIEPSSRRNQRMLLGALFGLSAADGFITRFIITEGLGREGNLWLEQLSSSDALIVVKILAAGLAAYLLWQLYSRKPKLIQGITAAFVFFYTLVVFWNNAIAITAA